MSLMWSSGLLGSVSRATRLGFGEGTGGKVSQVLLPIFVWPETDDGVGQAVPSRLAWRTHGALRWSVARWEGVAEEEEDADIRV